MTDTKFRMLAGMLFAVALIFLLPKEEIFYGYISAGEKIKVEQVQISGLKIAPSQVTISVTVGNDTVTGIMYENLAKNLNPNGSFTKGHKRGNLYYLDVVRSEPFIKQIK